MAIRFGVSSTVKNRLPRYSNFWDGTAVFSPFTATGSYDALATYTVGAGGLSSVTFAGIPTGGQYSHLQLRYFSKDSRTGSNNTLVSMQFNGDTGNNYVYHQLYGVGSGTPTSSGGTANASIYTYSGDTNQFGAGIIDILDYASAKNKVTRALSGVDENGGGIITFSSGLWLNTSAINSIRITPFVANFQQYSQFALYGVRG